MPWPSLIPPSPGTVITSAWESAMVNDPLLWLRLLTGNGDPSGPNLVVVSAGPASSAWGKVTGDVLSPGAAVANLGYTPLNRAGDVVQESLTVSRTATGTPADGVLYLGVTGGNYYMAKLGTDLYIHGSLLHIDNGAAINGTTTHQGAVIVNGGSLSVTGGSLSVTGDISVARAAPNAVVGAINLGNAGHQIAFDGARLSYDAHTIWHDGNDGVNSGLDADVLRGLTPGSAANNIPINNGVINTNLVATRAENLQGYSPGNGSNQIPISNGTTVLGLWAARADTLQGYSPSATSSAGAIPIADAAGKLDAWVTPTSAAPVPSGLIAFIATASLPSGWAFYTALNGRVLVGAGSAGVANNQTFAVGTSYPTSGANWGHADTVNIQHAHAHATTHNHGASALGVAGHTGSPNPMTLNLNVTAGPGGETYVGNHSHDAVGSGSTMDVDGTTDSAAPGGTDFAGSTTQATIGVVWIPPSHALNAIIKT